MLKFVNVTKTFGNITAISNVTFDIEPGEFAFITGPSGAGKSTVLNLILHKYLPDRGQIIVNDRDVTKLKSGEVSKLRQSIGFVFQDFKVLPERTVLENIEVALAIKGLAQNLWKDRTTQVLNMVGLENRANLFPAQLSGGEVQRAALARALAISPELVLADEPTGNLDWETAESIMELFDKVNKTGKTVIIATHHMGLIDKMKKRTIKMKAGKVESDSKARKTQAAPNKEAGKQSVKISVEEK
jgi:cell division transport system ATP-binding protein